MESLDGKARSDLLYYLWRRCDVVDVSEISAGVGGRKTRLDIIDLGE